jgi:hypothetical protein
MIVVTGTKRSGTSLWMQVMQCAGFPVLGAAFPGKWGDSIRAANPAGFYESLFRQGVFHKTNPDPRTGRYLKPAQTRRHAVKVFVPGLVKSDLAYLDHVIATVRPWREYVVSLQRLWAMEDEWRVANSDELGLGERETLAERRARQGAVPPALEWWFQNFELLLDASMRGYPFHMVTYDRLLRDPEAELAPLLEWLGGGDLAGAVAAVRPELRTSQAPAVADTGIEPDDAELFDAFYQAVDNSGRLDRYLIGALNELNGRLVTRWDAERAARTGATGAASDDLRA